jgi:hypothetical protein
MQARDQFQLASVWMRDDHDELQMAARNEARSRDVCQKIEYLRALWLTAQARSQSREARLKAHLNGASSSSCPFHCRCQEAADEVERLRDALADLYWQAQDAPLYSGQHKDERENARILLGIPKTS